MKTDKKLQEQEVTEQMLDNMDNELDQEVAKKNKMRKNMARGAEVAGVAGLGAAAATVMSQMGDVEAVASTPLAQDEELIEPELDAENIASTSTSSHSHAPVVEPELEAEDIAAEPIMEIKEENIVIDDSDFDVAFVEPVFDDDDVAVLPLADGDIHVEPIDIESIIIDPYDPNELGGDIAYQDDMDIYTDDDSFMVDDYNPENDMASADDVSDMSMDIF